MAYAERTAVPVEQSIAEIRKTVTRYKGEQFLFGVTDDRVIVGFSKEGRQALAYDTKEKTDDSTTRKV